MLLSVSFRDYFVPSLLFRIHSKASFSDEINPNFKIHFEHQSNMKNVF